MDQTESDLCKQLNNIRIKEENTVGELAPKVHRLKESIKDSSERMKFLESQIMQAQIEGRILEETSDRMGDRSGRRGLGTIAESMSNLSTAIRIEQLEAEFKHERKRCEDLVSEHHLKENLLHNARENAKIAVDNMRRNGCRLPSGR